MRATYYTAAFVVVACVFLGVYAGRTSPETSVQFVVLAGLILFSRDTLFAGVARPGPRSLGNPLRWAHALHICLFVVAVVQIFAWSGPAEIAGRMPFAVTFGAASGLLKAFLRKNDSMPSPLSPEFRLDQSADASLLGRLVYFAWPVAALVIILMSTLFPPDGGWSGVFPLFQMSFLPFLVALYPLRGGLVSNFPDHIPRISGFVLLLSALILGG